MDNITMRYKAMVDGLAKEFKEESDNEQPVVKKKAVTSVK